MVPSVYMPPLYVYFIFLIDVFSPEILNLVQSILITQILLSAITTYFFYKINFFLFNKKLSIISSYIFSLFPLNIYSSLQISSISLQIFLSVIFLYLILKILSGNDKIKICLFLSFISGLTVLLRGEFIIIYFFTVVYLIYYKKLNFYKVAVIILVTILTTSPYLVRNYMVFEKITVTKSFGYNLIMRQSFLSLLHNSFFAFSQKIGFFIYKY